MLKAVDPVADECDVRAAFDAAPRLPAAVTSLVSGLNEKVLSDLSFRRHLLALCVMVLGPRYSMLVLASPKNPPAVLGRFLEIVDHRLRQATVGWHPWMPGRRIGSARGIYNELHGDGRLVDAAISKEAQYCADAMLNDGRPSAQSVGSPSVTG